MGGSIGRIVERGAIGRRPERAVPVDRLDGVELVELGRLGQLAAHRDALARLAGLVLGLAVLLLLLLAGRAVAGIGRGLLGRSGARQLGEAVLRRRDEVVALVALEDAELDAALQGRYHLRG